MDPTGIGGLLVGIAALINSIKSRKKAADAKQQVAQLRAQMNQMVNVNQAPVVNVSPVFNFALPPGAPKTGLTEGEAQLSSTPVYELGPAVASPPKTTEPLESHQKKPESGS